MDRLVDGIDVVLETGLKTMFLWSPSCHGLNCLWSLSCLGLGHSGVSEILAKIE